MKYSKKKFSCLREQESRCFDEMWMKAMAGKDDKHWSLETMWPLCYDNFLLLLHWRQSNDLATVADDSNTMCACSNAETTAFLESALQKRECRVGYKRDGTPPCISGSLFFCSGGMACDCKQMQHLLLLRMNQLAQQSGLERHTNAQFIFTNFFKIPIFLLCILLETQLMC